MTTELDYDAEDARLRAIALRVTASLDARPRVSKPRSDSRIAALATLDAQKIAKEFADGTLTYDGRTVVWKRPTD